MCILCLRHNDFSLDHLIEEVNKIKEKELAAKAFSIKNAIKNYEIWLASNHIDGFERAALETTLENLKQAQYILSRKM